MPLESVNLCSDDTIENRDTMHSIRKACLHTLCSPNPSRSRRVTLISHNHLNQSVEINERDFLKPVELDGRLHIGGSDTAGREAEQIGWPD